MTSKLIFLFFTILMSVAQAQSLRCEHLFTPTVLSEQQIQQAILNISSLRLRLETTKAEEDANLTSALLNYDLIKKEKALLFYLETQGVMTRAEYFEKVRAKIAELQSQVQKDQDHEDKAKETQARDVLSGAVDGSHFIFRNVQPGSFIAERGAKKVTVDAPFEMMATSVTQLMWRKVVELSEKYFPGETKLKPDPSGHKNDLNPVEMVSFNEVQIWIRALNKLSKADVPELSELIVGHKKEDQYNLPTERQWEFVASARGTYHKENPLTREQLLEYSWLDENSQGKPQAVAQRKAFVVDGAEFFDLHGNVREWMQDIHEDTYYKQEDRRVVRGRQAYKNSHSTITRDSETLDMSNAFLGFRLVRIKKPRAEI